ncbi:sirohydrochlorin chelatase [Thiolapillus brandeum]|uniref:Cobalamin biosynthesis protein CbiX n=1 Tax=Thiolapillus brandeum TaxID=1076588 RepID=A0A7U6JJ07_9GAMM|nr:CbiX/SirB N-terminal domain-containing protein [Thiolapillus brandeum]BAO45352.1 cobalamin biosynthesis protein CbiX [Thiolapillus brandeum]
MNALLVVAHGSRRETSNEEVRKLCRRIEQEAAGEEFFLVRAGFLELAEPSIPEGIGQCVEAGADRVVVLPYFLSAGRHVSEDIPAEVEEARRLHPKASIVLAPYLGSAPGVSRLLVELAVGGKKNGDSAK